MAQNQLSRPLMVYDGDCQFCGVWIAYWKRLTSERVAYAPYQEAANKFPQVPRERFERAVQIILPDGGVMSGAHAVFQALAYAPGKAWMLWLYENIPGVASASEWFYCLVAAHRDFFYRLTRLLWGEELDPLTYSLVRWVFLRALGLIYLFAFASFGLQITGLIGANGILPLQPFLQATQTQFGATSYWLVPTVFWLNASDVFLQFVTIAGVSLSALLVLGFTHRVILILLFVGYLSLVSAGQDFMAFQWDTLLLEAGFLAIFLMASSDLMIWLYRWLVFRLMFLSGALKLLSGDPTWRNFTALDFHFETQPLPTLIGWYMHQLPVSIHQASVVVMFVIELLMPFLIFAPRRPRLFAASAMIFLQVMIFLTGNYAFFNILAIALCLFLLDDSMLRRFFPQRLATRINHDARRQPSAFTRAVTTALAVVIFLVSGAQLLAIFWGIEPDPVPQVLEWVSPPRVVNTYGLFSAMTTARPEIVIEGSNDGATWREYEFKYKPGDVRNPPTWAEPHQPRLDWQMWFEALGVHTGNPFSENLLARSNPSAGFALSNSNVDSWFGNLMVRLLQGSPKVLALLGKNPFPDAPPRYVRARLYDYRFTDIPTLSREGVWWRRRQTEIFFPTISIH